MNRRNFLKLAGGGVILAAGGIGLFASTRTPTHALAPWASAGGANYADPRMKALSYAILAPNPHNRQPWIVALEGDNALTLRFDVTRQLPHTDPFDRQLTIGLGCFLELMTMAANATGYAVKTDLFPDGVDEKQLDERIIARSVFKKDPSVPTDPLWAEVPLRRSNKEPYDTTREIEQSKLDLIIASAKHQTQMSAAIDNKTLQDLRDLTEEALLVELKTPHTFKESVDLFRIGKSEVNANPDGIDFSGPFFETLAVTGQFTREQALDTESLAFQGGIDAATKNCQTAMGHMWLTTKDNNRISQIAAGRDWLRMNLAATKQGIACQPMSQALQEFPEMAEHYQAIHKRLAPNGETVQMLARIGYGPQIPVSPRWPIEAKLKS